MWWLCCLRDLYTLEHKKKMNDECAKLYISQVLLVSEVQELKQKTTFD